MGVETERRLLWVWRQRGDFRGYGDRQKGDFRGYGDREETFVGMETDREETLVGMETDREETFHQILRTLKKSLARPAPLKRTRLTEMTTKKMHRHQTSLHSKESDTKVMNIKLKCSENWAFPGVIPAS